MSGPLALRLPTVTDETCIRQLDRVCSSERFDFLAGAGTLSDCTDGEDYSSFLDAVHRQHEGIGLPEGWVPADFLLAEITSVAGERTVVGRASVRYGLTEHLLNYEGHIGYAVAPNHRRRGHATRILQQSLTRLADHGIDRALLTCDDTNIGSATVIETCSGVLEDRRTDPDGVLIRRYWIDL